MRTDSRHAADHIGVGADWDEVLEENERLAEVRQESLHGGISKVQVNGRLAKKKAEWGKLLAAGLASAFVFSVVCTGYRLDGEWKDGPPRPFAAPNHGSTRDHVEFVREALDAALTSGAVARTDRERLHCVLPLGVAQHAGSGKLRLIYDARYVNRHMKDWFFKMETLAREGRHVFKELFFGSIIDISSAFHHVQMAESAWRYLGFEFEGQFYHWRSLPFGLKSAPRVFTKVMRPLVGLWRQKGFRVLPYLDDFPAGAGSKEEAFEQAQSMLRDLDRFGFLVKLEKCEGVVHPVQSLQALGFIVDLGKQVFRAPKQKLVAIVHKAKTLLDAERGRVLVRQIAAFTGLVISLTLALGAVARIRTRALLRNLEARLKPGERSCDRRPWARHVWLSAEAKQELGWWAQHALSFENRGMPIAHLLPKLVCDASLGSDASATGYGGWVAVGEEKGLCSNVLLANLAVAAPEGVSLKEVARAARKGIEVAGAFSREEALRSSSWRELWGVRMLLATLGRVLQYTTIRVQLDSSVATGALGGELPKADAECIGKKGVCTGGSKKEDLQEVVMQILDICADYSIDMQVVWKRREENTRADAISHHFEEDQHDYTLRGVWVGLLEKRFGIIHEVDRFASGPENCVVQSGRFNARYGHEDESWEWADALTVNWAGVENWVHPPYLLINHVLDHAERCKAKGTLIVPDWPTRSWWPRLFRGKKGGVVKGTPIGTAARRAVKEIVWLGPASAVLYYPSKCSEFAERNMPMGNILAVRFDFALVE